MTGKTLVLTRLLDASPEAVFPLWTDPKHLAKWWGPKGFTNPVCESDPRVGGKMRVDMKAPDGTVHPMTAVFEELVPPSATRDGRIVTRNFAHLGGVDAPSGLDVLTTVTFAAEGGKTRLTLTAQVTRVVPEMAVAVQGMDQGWSESLDRLSDLVATLA